MRKATRSGNESRIMKEFLEEFNPFYNKEVLKDMTYEELASAIKDTVEIM